MPCVDVLCSDDTRHPFAHDRHGRSDAASGEEPPGLNIGGRPADLEFRGTTTELRTWKTYKEKESTGMAYRCLPRWLDLECPPVLEPCTRV
jgi:hypothetical protein